MQLIHNSVYKQTRIHRKLIYYGFLSIALVFIILITFSIGQVYIAFALLISIITFLAFLYSPIIGVMMLLGASTMTGFFNRLALHLTGIPAPVDFIRFGLEILLFFMGIRLFLTQPLKNQKLSRFVDISVSAYLLVSTIYTLNLFYAGPLITLWGWRWTCLPIIMYFLGRRIGKRPEVLLIFNKTIIILLLLLSGYAIYQAAVGLPSYEKLWFNMIPAAEKASAIIEGSMFIAGKPRLPSLTANHVSFTLLSGYFFILILFMPKGFLSNKFRLLRYAALISTIAYLVLTLERSAIAMIMVGIFSSLILYFRKKIGRFSWVLIILVVVFGLTFMSLIDVSSIPWTKETIAFRRIVELTNPFQANTVKGRATSIWPVAIDRLKANPFGYGLGTFHTTSQNQSLGYEFFIPPHNMYFQIALEIGVIGFVIFTIFVFSYVKLLINAYIYRIKRKLVHASIASLAAVLAVGLFNYPLEPPLAFFFWIFTGLTTTSLVMNIQPNKLDLKFE